MATVNVNEQLLQMANCLQADNRNFHIEFSNELKSYLVHCSRSSSNLATQEVSLKDVTKRYKNMQIERPSKPTRLDSKYFSGTGWVEADSLLEQSITLQKFSLSSLMSQKKIITQALGKSAIT